MGGTNASRKGCKKILIPSTWSLRGEVWRSACEREHYFLKETFGILQVWKSDAISAARADITGKAILPGVPPGTHYLMLSTRYNNQPIS
jgi:hypothetical protein